MNSADAVAAIQRSYPQIYLACHVRHMRARTSGTHISPSDSSLLAHLDLARPVSPARLARHLGVRASTLSASLKRLAAFGYVDLRRDARDARRIELRLTRAGARAMREGSVLDARRVARVLARLSPAQARQAVSGLALLARASRAASGRGL